jgi:predicted AlkP superfamily phosphohydrolase/phosphomutase
MKILVIGLDAATMDLIGPWAAAGHLPALAGLMREGASTPLLSTPNMHSASAWTSILTGLNPGRHGLYVFSDRDFATGKQVFFKGGDRTGELISTHLAARGLTSGFVNVPMTYPAEAQPGGFVISGLDAPSLNEHAFSPADLRSELFGNFPEYRFAPGNLGDLLRAGRLDDATAEWLKLIEIQTGAAEYLIATRPIDFFMMVFTASDWGGHNLWKFAEDGEVHGSSPLLEIYRALDQAIERLLNHAGSETQTYVISDHGMGAHTGASYHLAEWLEENGYMVRSKQTGTRHSMMSTASRAAKLLPVSVRERVKAGLGEARIERLRAAEKDSFYSSIDWEHTVAYTEPGRHVININLEGRNAAGTVPSDDYDKLCLKLMDDLARWKDSRGIRVVDRIVRRDEAYSGPFTERASDLYVYWNLEARAGEPPGEVRDRGFWWSGDHRPEGILICKGPGIQRSAKLATPKVYDLVPTIMYGSGLPVPDGLDGHVIESAFTEEFRASHPIQIEAASAQPGSAPVDLSADEEKMIEEKLRSLGYL